MKEKIYAADKRFNAVIYVICFLFCLITLLPLLHVLASSFSSPQAVYTGKVGIWPVGWSLTSYKRVFAEQSIWRGYLNTLIYTAIGTVLSIILQMTAAYPLSRKDMKGHNVLTFVYVFTMFVNGGLIPTYLVVKGLGMLNTIWAMILPGCLGVYSVIIVRTYITTAIPWELQQAAMIDGAGPFRLFLQIILPLSKPILAVMALYGIVGYWNSYFNALIYVTNDKLHPLQLVLQKILVTNQTGSLGGSGIGNAEAALLAESLKYSTIVVSCAPILLLYPFLQKYFEKGLMIGSLKG